MGIACVWVYNDHKVQTNEENGDSMYDMSDAVCVVH